MATRKSIGDPYGVRSEYVVEQLFGGKWLRCGGGFGQFKEATKLKEKRYKTAKRINHTWTRKHFRVALYVRAEEET